MFPLVNLTKVPTAAHFMYFPKSQFQLGSPLILVTAPEFARHSYSQKSWMIEAFSLCVILSKAPSGPPWNEGHQPKVRHKTSVLEVPVQEQL